MTNQISVWLKGVALESFDFVGIQEFYREDLQDLQQQLSWPDLSIQTTNTNRYPGYAQGIRNIFADTQLVNQLALLNQADLELYHHALNLRAQRRQESVFIQPLLADWNRSQTLWQLGQESPLVPAKQPESTPAPQQAAAVAPEDPEVLPLANDHYPLPPESLRWRVINNRDPHAYIESGRRIAQYFDQHIKEITADFKTRMQAKGYKATNFLSRLSHLLIVLERLPWRIRSSGRDLTTYTRILDFGCGSGRILRGLPPLTSATLVGCDIDQEAIAWDTAHLSFGEFSATHEYPPLPFEEHAFDFVYAVSIFTHLDEAHQLRWLAEWKRIIKPGGLLLVTFRGAQDAEKLKEPQKTKALAQLKSYGLYYHTTNFWDGVFPAYYQQAFHTPKYVKKHWAKYFSIIGIDPPGSINQYSVWMRNTARHTPLLKRRRAGA